MKNLIDSSMARIKTAAEGRIMNDKNTTSENHKALELMAKLDEKFIEALVFWPITILSAIAAVTITPAFALISGVFGLPAIMASASIIFIPREIRKLEGEIKDKTEVHDRLIKALPAPESLQPPQMPPLLKLAGPATAFNDKPAPEAKPSQNDSNGNAFQAPMGPMQ